MYYLVNLKKYMPGKVILEACVEDLHEAIHALRGGAHQLEVCSSLDKDGLTPDESILRDIIEKVKLPSKVMIRCREGDFFYSQEEINKMVSEMQRLKAFKIDGFVFGALAKDAEGKTGLDLNAIYQICKTAFPFPVTIHKAIDSCDDILSQVRQLRQISNIKFILSSGGAIDARSGAAVLKQMQEDAGDQIRIIAAGKITPQNLPDIRSLTGLMYYHGRKIV
jgi:copper homeostasis protein